MLHFDLLLAFSLFGFACALKCYQTDSKTGENVIVDDSNFIYCISFPFVQKGQYKIVGKDKIFTATADGLTKDELDNDYGLFFDDSMPEYSLLSMCLFEEKCLRSNTNSGACATPISATVHPKLTNISTSCRLQSQGTVSYESGF
uniref:Uncharacterized protein n=1 Tax=Acrobeloides nanus TaxID=290746 RepID=A0A914DFK1_9BILA